MLIALSTKLLLFQKKPVDNNWNGESEDEDARESAKSTNLPICLNFVLETGNLQDETDQFAKHCLWVEVVAHSCESHQAPPCKIDSFLTSGSE